MRKFSVLVKESEETNKIKLDKKPATDLSVSELKEYLKIADKFISDEAKSVTQWIIDNYDYYVKNISPLVDWFNNPSFNTNDLRKLHSDIIKVNNTGRILEIPLFMSRNDFNDIIEIKKSPDEVIMDFESERGRNEIAKRYLPLVHKIANSWIGKTALDKDELFAAGMRGLGEAMKAYGKKSDRAIKRGIDIDMSKYKSYTFLQFAAQYIRIFILEDVKDNSHLVRIPRSRQAKDKAEKGYIAKSNSVSGDKGLGSKDGGEGKTLFDIVGGMENPTKEMDQREIESIWDSIMKDLEEKFGPKTIDIFKNHFGFGITSGEKKLSGKEMAKKYGYNSPSSITAEITKVINFIKKDKAMFKKFQDIFELMQEAKHDEDEYDNDNEPVYINSKIMEDRMYDSNRDND